MAQRYGYLSNGTFRTFSSIDGCRKAVRTESFKSTDEYQIVRFSSTHIKTGYQSNDVLVGMAYQDYNNPKMVRYQPANSKMSYPIRYDGTLDKKNAYEVIL